MIRGVKFGLNGYLRFVVNLKRVGIWEIRWVLEGWYFEGVEFGF